METRARRNAVSLGGLLAVAFLGGCSAAPGEQDEPSTLESELGEASCATLSSFNDAVRADGLSPINGGPMPLFGDVSRSPAAYSHPTCFKAWKVRVDGPTGGNSWNPGTDVTRAYVGLVNPPANQTDCNNTTIRGVLYAQQRSLNGDFFQEEVEDRRFAPYWDPILPGSNKCVTSWVALGELNRAWPGLGYHVAATARIGTTTIPVDVVVTKSRIAPPTRPLCETLNTCVRAL
jgi:hypothetical protein